jgi:Arc/MetJ-type ribon-helix-helix transcriptional regulator
MNKRLKFIIKDLIERGYFKNKAEVIEAAISALQIKLADDTYTDEYDDAHPHTHMELTREQ